MSALPIIDLPSTSPTPEPLDSFERYTPRPGHPDWPRLDAEADALAHDLLPTLDRPRSGLRAFWRQMRAWGTAARNYIANRRLHRQGQEDLRPLYFIWTTLRSCNFTCTYCDDHRGRKYPDLPTEGTLDTEGGMRLLEVMRTRAPAVYFAGGEPTLRNDLPQLARKARDLAYHPVVINTNAAIIDRRLKQPDWKGWLADMDMVIVSLDGLTLDWLGRTWVTKRPEDVLRNLLLLKRLAEPMRFKLLVNCVIQPGRVQEACDVFDLCQDLGIWFTPVPVNVGPRVAGGLHGDPDYEALVERILASKREGGLVTGSLRLNERLLRSTPLTCRNALKPHVDFDGKLIWPCKATVNVEPEYLDVLAFDDVDSLYDAAVERRSPTRFHGPGPEQCGAQCNWAQNYSTDAYAHGLAHPVDLAKLVWEFVAR